MGHVYAGGLYGGDNRVATINCYALGSVTADAGYTNRIHAGGFIGQAGGVHYNCYAAGDVIAMKDCTDVGGFNGRSAGINVERECFWNSDAVQKINDTDVAEKAGNGADVSSHDNVLTAKSLAELSAQDFAELLNANRAKMTEVSETLRQELTSDSAEGTLTQPYYYEGDGSDLNEWVTKEDSTVVFSGQDSHDNCPSEKFRDVDVEKWYHEGIDYVVARDMMKGVADDLFALAELQVVNKVDFFVNGHLAEFINILAANGDGKGLRLQPGALAVVTDWKANRMRQCPPLLI